MALSPTLDSSFKTPSVSRTDDGVVDAMPLFGFWMLPSALVNFILLKPCVTIVALLRDRKCNSSLPATFSTPKPRGPLIFPSSDCNDYHSGSTP